MSDQEEDIQNMSDLSINLSDLWLDNLAPVSDHQVMSIPSRNLGELTMAGLHIELMDECDAMTSIVKTRETQVSYRIESNRIKENMIVNGIPLTLKPQKSFLNSQALVIDDEVELDELRPAFSFPSSISLRSVAKGLQDNNQTLRSDNLALKQSEALAKDNPKKVNNKVNELKKELKELKKSKTA
ncbi:hypothetical protein Q3G72_000586 [Acer saccharum]|nr:hypothetical protein Q3G72_000586 [Acer saccharum]